MDSPKYECVRVNPSAHEGNIFYLIGQTLRGLKRANVGESELAQYREEVEGLSYDDALTLTGKWVTVTVDAEPFEEPAVTVDTHDDLEDLI